VPRPAIVIISGVLTRLRRQVVYVILDLDSCSRTLGYISCATYWRMAAAVVQTASSACDAAPGSTLAANVTCGCDVDWGGVGSATAPTVAVLLACVVVSGLLLAHSRFHLSRLRFRLACLSRGASTHAGTLIAVGLAISPMVFAVAVAVHVAVKTAASCPAQAPMLAVFVILLTWSTLLGAYGFLRWWFDGWVWSNGVRRALGGSVGCAFAMYVAKTIDDNSVCAACMTYTFDLRAMLFVVNLVPLTIFVYLSEDDSVPVDLPGFLKRSIEADPLDVVLRVDEAVATRRPRASGVYTPAVRGEHPRRYVQRHRLDECFVEHRRVGALSYWVLVLPAEASTATEAGHPARVLYARCSDSATPPCGSWHAVSEARAFYVDEDDNIYVHGTAQGPAAGAGGAPATAAAAPAAAFAHASAENDAAFIPPGPATVTVEHNVVHELEARGNRAVLAGTKQRQKLLTALYVLATLSTLSSGFATYFLPAFKLARWSGFYSFFALLWIEASGALRKVVGIRLGAGGVTLVNVGCRVVLLVMAGGTGGGANIFDAICTLYALFASPLAWALAEAEFPTAPAREVLRRELLDALPAWLFGSGAGDGGGAISYTSHGGGALSPAASMESCIRAFARWRTTSAGPLSREDAEHSAATMLCWFVLGTQTLLFGLFAFVCWKLGLASRLTLVSLCTVALAVAFTRFFAAYTFHGHVHNSLPDGRVVALASIAAIVGVCSTFALWYELQSSAAISRTVTTTVALVGCNASLVFTLGMWAYKNWAASDFVFLHFSDVARAAGGSAGAPEGAASILLRLARRGGATLVGFIVIVSAQVAAGGILVAITNDSVLGWLYTCVSLLVFVTFCGFKAHFCTLKVPTSSCLFACAILVGYGFVVHQVGGILWAVGVAVVYVLVVLCVASLFQWADNGWRMDWNKTRGIILAVGGISFAMVGAVVAVSNVAIDESDMCVRSLTRISVVQ
jgi:hypothetical protein